MPTLTTRDGIGLHYKDWGTGRTVVFSHGWPLSADAWDAQMLALGEQGCRVLAHDRRGHGRSDQTWDGNDMDTYADDLAEVMDSLDLREVVLVGHSMGGGEVARYVGRHGTARLAGVVLIGAVTPLMLRTPAHPNGLEREVFDGIRKSVRDDRAQFFKDLPLSFYGYNRKGAKPSQGVIDAFWRQGMQASIRGVYECVAQFSETDFNADLAAIDVPTLIIHGDDDQIVPIDVTAKHTVERVRDARLEIYPGASHGLATTHAERLNRDLLAFVQARASAPRREPEAPLH